MKEIHFWMWIAALTAVLGAALGGTISGIGGAIVLGIIGYVSTLLMAGMICTGAKRNYPKDFSENEKEGADDEAVEV